MRLPRGGGGGHLLPGRPGLGALGPPTAPPLGRAAGAHYPLAVGTGGAGVWTCYQPHSARSCELALRALGAARGRPGGGASCLGVGRPGSGALPPPTACPSGHAAGAHYALAVGAGGAAVGTRHQPQGASSCVLAWRAVGAARGRPGEGASCLGVGRPGSGALLTPTTRPLGVRPGSTTHWLWVRGLREWGPVTNPTVRALASWLCTLWGRHAGAWGGRLLPGCGESGVGRSPTPGHSSFRACGPGPLPTGYGCGGAERGDPSPTPQRALLRASFARCGGGTRAPGAGRSPTLDHSSFAGVRPGAHYPLAVGAGGAGLGTCHQPHRARSCELG